MLVFIQLDEHLSIARVDDDIESRGLVVPFATESPMNFPVKFPPCGGQEVVEGLFLPRLPSDALFRVVTLVVSLQFLF